MGFFKRLFSADYRAAVAAEAAGDLDLAAERYAMAGQREAAVRVHLARAQRADKRADEIDALRDALHWAPVDGGWRKQVSKKLGEALLSRARAEAVATDRDLERVREAARLLVNAEEYEVAGDALESIGDDREAARAFKKGGYVDRMIKALGRDERRLDKERAVREAFADYELHMQGGDRDAALKALRDCVEAAERKGEYRRLLDDLESRVIGGGRVELRIRHGETISVVAGEKVVMGRDPLGDLVLRSGGVSRRHAEIIIERDVDSTTFSLRDAGSRNGTLVGEMPLTGTVPLVDDGSFKLGEDCEVLYHVDHNDGTLIIRIDQGLDQGTLLVITAEHDPAHLERVIAELPIAIYFRSGRPILQHPTTALVVNGKKLAHGDVQLIHGDQLVVDGVELEVQ